MGVQVTWDPTVFLQTFPQFNTITTTTLSNFVLPLAEQYVRNDGGGPVTTAAAQTNLLNLAVAHLCQLFWGINGEPPSPLAGQITSATEGSVSVSVAAPSDPRAEWFAQTNYGNALWQAMAPYRTMRYLPNCRARVTDPWRRF